ncbi:MAG: hypothetical protein WC059_00805 [Candidatus Paceibacterota bacterium]
MKGFLRLIFTNPRWFLGTLLAIVVLFGFFWRIIDPTGSAQIINNFLADVWALLSSIMVFALMILGISIMLGGRPWWLGGGRRGGGH